GTTHRRTENSYNRDPAPLYRPYFDVACPFDRLTRDHAGRRIQELLGNGVLVAASHKKHDAVDPGERRGGYSDAVRGRGAGRWRCPPAGRPVEVLAGEEGSGVAVGAEAEEREGEGPARFDERV